MNVLLKPAVVVSGWRGGNDGLLTSAQAAVIETTLSRPLERFGENLTLFHGGARGVDLFCAELAESFGATLREMRADWRKFGRRAGPVRNREMLLEAKDYAAGLVTLWAYPHPVDSVGTVHCVTTALQLGITVCAYPLPRKDASPSRRQHL